MEPTVKRSLASLLSRRGSSVRSIPSTASLTQGTDLPENGGKLGLTTVYEPDESHETRPLVDIVFIHGLGGSSIKTWSYSSDAQSFWPQAWLPQDADFADARIHVFGYMASWKSRQENPLNIHFIAQTLLVELKNDPLIRKAVSSRIILVGHSMGGCVAKKAYILAHQDPTGQALAQRIHSMFFLGTPHRGSDLAPVLDNMASVAFGKKPFLKDLIPNSAALTDINDAFRHHALNLRLWSFYETKPMAVGLVERIVVEKSSATLDYPNEEIAAMSADHRHLCKYKSREDPNYRLLRNALHAAIDMARKTPVPNNLNEQSDVHSVQAAQESWPRDEAALRSFLGIDDSFEDDLAAQQMTQEPGTCEWLTQGAQFLSWEEKQGPQVLWLTGRPGTGKSVLSGHVAATVTDSSPFCSYFFFKHGKSGKSTLSDCFLSLAYQMGVKDDVIGMNIAKFMDSQPTWDKSVEASIWRRLFVGVIFKCPSVFQHVWVIDGIDECTDFNALFTKRLLVGIPDSLRLFATSRDLEKISRGLKTLADRVIVHTLSDEDNLNDMRLLISSKLTELDRHETREDEEAMCETILQKSRGSFLWVRLILQEFESVWTVEAMEEVLSEVPGSLQEFYQRILVSIETDPHKKTLAKAILKWVVLAARPLSMDELRCAIKLDVNQTLQNLRKAIPNICGQLVFIDHSQRLQIIHETARSFLLQAHVDSDLAVCSGEGNSNLSTLLLRYLSSGVMDSHRTQKSSLLRPGKLLTTKRLPTALLTQSIDTALLDYAAQYFPDHVFRSSSPENDTLMKALCDFMQHESILHWMERHARREDLGLIANAAKSLQGFLGRGTKHDNHADTQTLLISRWILDLSRVTAKFRAQLLSSPSSIHSLIPGLCPPESIISQTCYKENQLGLLLVRNLPGGSWDDCISWIDYAKGQAICLAHGQGAFAVSFRYGRIFIYDALSLQCVSEIESEGSFSLLKFSLDDEMLAGCSKDRVVVWNTRTGLPLFKYPTSSVAQGITFIGTDYLLFLYGSEGILSWNMNTGELLPLPMPETEGYIFSPPAQPDSSPHRATFLSTENGEDLFVAVSYWIHPVCVWNLSDMHFIGQLYTSQPYTVDDMAFNPNPEITALVVSLIYGQLELHNYSTMKKELSKFNLCATRVCWSSDGYRLATGSSGGGISIFEFSIGDEGNMLLTPICRIEAIRDVIFGIAFNFDGLRFVSVVKQQCRVWEPEVLTRKGAAQDSSMKAVSDTYSGVMRTQTRRGAEIMSPLMAAPDGRYLAAGRADGSVFFFSSVDGSELGEAYTHGKGTPPSYVIFSDSGLLMASADGGGVVVAEVPQANDCGSCHKSISAKVILDRQSSEQLLKGLMSSIIALLFNAQANRLLVSTHDDEYLWDLSTGKVLLSRPLRRDYQNQDSNIPSGSARLLRCKRAFRHPKNPSLFLIALGNYIHTYRWSDFGEEMSPDGILLHRPSPFHYSETASMKYIPWGEDMIIEHTCTTAKQPGRLLLWPVAAFDASSPIAREPIQSPSLDAIGPMINSVIGVTESSQLLFIDKDLWVCSTDLTSSVTQASSANHLSHQENNVKSSTQRHFFALNEWHDLGKELSYAMIPLVTEVGSRAASGSGQTRLRFAFVAEDRVIVVERGMEFSETVVMKTKMTGTSVDYHWEVVAGSIHHEASK